MFKAVKNNLNRFFLNFGSTLNRILNLDAPLTDKVPPVPPISRGLHDEVQVVSALPPAAGGGEVHLLPVLGHRQVVDEGQLPASDHLTARHQHRGRARGGVDLKHAQVSVGHKQSPVGADSDPQGPPAGGLVPAGACGTKTLFKLQSKRSLPVHLDGASPDSYSSSPSVATLTSCFTIKVLKFPL